MLNSHREKHPLSVTLIIGYSYFYRHLGPQSRFGVCKQVESAYRRHLALCDEEHLHILSSFILAGGKYYIPMPELVLALFISHYPSEDRTITETVAALMSANEGECIQFFWGFIMQLDIQPLSLYVVSEVTRSLPDIGLPNLSCINQIISVVNTFISPESSFSQQETGLLVAAWLIAKECHFDPPNPFVYTNPSIIAMAIDCWATYARKGDLRKLPSFPASDNSVIQTAYLRVLVNAVENPGFSLETFSIQHWLWDWVLYEFNGKVPKPPTQSILCQSAEVLLLISRIANLLPSWVFIQCLKARTKSQEILGCLLKIVIQCPLCILHEFFKDFCDFVRFLLHFHLKSQIIELLDELLPIFEDSQNAILELLYDECDFFDPELLETILGILESLWYLVVDTSIYEMVVSTLLDVIGCITLPLNLCRTIISFFATISEIVPNHHNILTNIGLAPIYAIFQEQEPDFIANCCQSHEFYRCSQMYSGIVASDLITNPKYKLKDTWALIPSALLLLSRIPLQHWPITGFLFSILHHLVKICPKEAICLINRFIPQVIEQQYFKNVAEIALAIEYELQVTESTTFKIMAQHFFDSFSAYIPGNLVPQSFPAVEKLPESRKWVRFCIQRQFSLHSLLTKDMTHLYVLLELWANQVDTQFAQSLLQNNDTVQKKRHILRFLKKTQSPLANTLENDGWLQREQNNFRFSKIKVNEGNLDELMEIVPKPRGKAPTILLFLKAYHRALDCKVLIEQHLEELMNEANKQFWVLKILVRNNFTPFIHADEIDELVDITAIRLGQLNPSVQSRKLGVFVESLRNLYQQKQINVCSIFNISGSFTLVSLFISLSDGWNAKNLVQLMDIQRPSLQARIFQSLPTFFVKKKADGLFSVFRKQFSAFFNTVFMENPIVHEARFYFLTSITPTDSVVYELSEFHNNFLLDVAGSKRGNALIFQSIRALHYIVLNAAPHADGKRALKEVIAELKSKNVILDKSGQLEMLLA